MVGGSVALAVCLVVSVLPAVPTEARILFVVASLIFAWAAFWVRFAFDDLGRVSAAAVAARCWQDVDGVFTVGVPLVLRCR